MIEFVPMKKHHINGMVMLEEQCFNTGFAAKTFEKELENKIAIYFVAVKGDEILGYAGLWNVCGSAEIIEIAVHKESRRQGIASGLLSALANECIKQNVLEINLEVRESNNAARNLYKKHGFVENGLRKRYYDNTEDAILMQKQLRKGENNENSCN